MLSYTKKLLASPPQLSSTDLHDALLVILSLLQKCDTNSDESLSIYTKVSSFLTALRVTKLDHKAEYIAEAAKAVLRHSDLVDLPLPKKDELHPEDGPVILDIVGTGGDGQNTFNVSTSAAIVASGIQGLKICKHGGKASTSNSGAGDLIGTLGCDMFKVNSSTVPKLWPDNTFMFLLAPFFFIMEWATFLRYANFLEFRLFSTYWDHFYIQLATSTREYWAFTQRNLRLNMPRQPLWYIQEAKPL